MSAQAKTVQTKLTGMFPESEGYAVAGPMALIASGDDRIDRIFAAVRVLCLNPALLGAAETRLQEAHGLEVRNLISHIETADQSGPAGFRGVVAEVTLEGMTCTIRLATPQQTRFLIWASQQTLPFSDHLSPYAIAVSDYLYAVDTGNVFAYPPLATAFGLPEAVDIYANPPDYVIPGYDNYMGFLLSHRAIHTDFAAGLLAFIPSDSLRLALRDGAPAEAYPNKEWPMIQQEYRKFFDRGGDLRAINTLSRTGFDTLQAGEYFFAVGMNGAIRLGRELSRAEVERRETETGRKLARANHAFLFPGEPVLTAGAVFIERNAGGPRISELTAQSGHYFYSNVSATIREDITLRSDHYLLTLGHALKALDSLGIPCDTVLVRKF